MKPSISLLLIAVSVCGLAIHAASISRKTLVVSEPLDFLTKFILNKRAKAVNSERNDNVQTLGATKRASVTLETPIVAAESIRIEVKAKHPRIGEVSETKETKNLIENDSEKLAVVSTSPRSSSTTEASTWSWWQLNNPKKSVKTKPRDVIKLSFHGDANTARRSTGTDPVEVVEAVADVTPVEAVPVEVVETVAKDAIVESTGASASSIFVATTPQSVEKKAYIKIVASPKHHILYEDNTPDFHVTLQVIKVEIDPAHIKPVPETVAVDVKPAEIASGVDVSASSSAAAGTGEANAVGAQTVAVATAISDISVDEGISTVGVTSGNVQGNLDSESYVPQSGLAGTGVAEGAEGAGGDEGDEGDEGAGETEVTGVTGIAEIAERPVGKSKNEAQNEKSRDTEAEFDSSEEDE